MEEINHLRFESRTAWRQWLENHGSTENEVWLVLAKKHAGSDFTLTDAVEEALCFGWIDGKLRRLDGDYFVLRFSPRQPASVWSRINRERAERLTARGKMTTAGMASIEEAKKHGFWDDAYTSKTRDELPQDLASALKENPQAENNFEKFANTYRNTYIGWVSSAKTDVTRRKRVMEVVRRSRLNLKPG